MATDSSTLPFGYMPLPIGCNPICDGISPPVGSATLPYGYMQLWGDGMFENSSNLNVVAKFDQECGIEKMQEEVNVVLPDQTTPVRYSIYAKQCSGPGAVETVRKHLDSGVLATVAAKQVQAFFNPIKVSDWTVQGQTCAVLAACAMSLGCTSFTGLKGYHMWFSSYVKFIKGLCPSASISNKSAFQLNEALDSFLPGTPYDFGSKSVAEAKQEEIDAGLDPAGAFQRWVAHAGGRRADEVPASPRPALKIPTMVGPCVKADMGYNDKPGECGKCLKPGAKQLCGRCKGTSYCDKVCQKKDWARHKAVCRRPEDAEVMREESSTWINICDTGL